jgi:hypothetical protein
VRGRDAIVAGVGSAGAHVAAGAGAAVPIAYARCHERERVFFGKLRKAG